MTVFVLFLVYKRRAHSIIANIATLNTHTYTPIPRYRIIIYRKTINAIIESKISRALNFRSTDNPFRPTIRFGFFSICVTFKKKFSHYTYAYIIFFGEMHTCKCKRTEKTPKMWVIWTYLNLRFPCCCWIGFFSKYDRPKWMFRLFFLVACFALLSIVQHRRAIIIID